MRMSNKTIIARNDWARRICWIGAIGSFIYSTPGTSESLRIDVFAALRGILPIFCYFLSFLICFPRDAHLRRINGKPELFLTVFILYCCLSSIWSYNSIGSLLKSINLGFAYLCVFRIPTLVTNSKFAFNQLFRISTLFIIAGLIEFILVPDLVFSRPSPTEAKRFNIIVPQIGANLLGIVLFVLIASLITGNFMQQKKFRHIKFFYMAILLLLLYEAHSRLIFATVILVSYYLAIRTAQRLEFGSSRGTYARISVFWATLIVINFLISSESVQGGVVSFFTRGQDSQGLSTLTGRTNVWSEALSFGNEKPIFGHGFYSGHRYALGSISTIIRSHNNLDNTWIETYIDLGLLGIFLLACLIAFTFLRLRKISSEYSQLSISILVVIVTNSAYNPGINMPSSTLIFFAYLISESRRHRKIQDGYTLHPEER